MGYVPFLRFDSAQYGIHVGISVAILMILVGLASLLYGWKMFKALVILSAALAGALLGWYLTAPAPHGYGLLPQNFAWVGPLVLGLLFGVVAIPLMKAGVFIIGASVGFSTVGPIVAQMIWRTPPPTTTQNLIVSVVALVVMGILALFIFRALVVIATSMLGSMFIISGIVKVIETGWYRTRNFFAEPAYQIPFAAAFVVLTILGVLFQANAWGAKPQKKPSK